MVEVGAETTSGLPVPSTVPPQLPLNQRRVVPVPPVAVREIVPPLFEQILLRSTLAEEGATGAGVTVTVDCPQGLVHPVEEVRERTKYVLVDASAPVLKGEPVKTSVPPQLPVYHWI